MAKIEGTKKANAGLFKSVFRIIKTDKINKNEYKKSTFVMSKAISL